MSLISSGINAKLNSTGQALTRLFCVFILGVVLSTQVKAAPVTVTDIVGRKVTLSQPLERFVMSEGRYVMALALVRPGNPVSGLKGMMQPVSWAYPKLEKQVFERFPEAKDIALFGANDQSSLSVEKLIDLKPEAAIFGIQDHGPGSKNKELLDQLQAAGIKVIFIDFRMDPLHNTLPSLKILSQLFASEQHAKKYIDFYQKKRDHIAATVANTKTKPGVFLQAHPGRFDCCVGMADGMLGPFVGFAGGNNIADAVAPGPVSKHTMEFLLVEDPDVWIGTASASPDDFAKGQNGVTLGLGVDRATAQKSLDQYLSSKEFQALTAVQKKRAHAIWHNFYNSPLNIVVLDAFARWIHPELFPDLDPEHTMSTIFAQYLPFDWSGSATSTNSR
ncbi:ABC transporter substrate-binding protein [Ketobacter sp. MCCC 1A13808]|uniref:ABC transporter substrate-binding protein n=1 Tax=Ketobacter sp. MCCC 1A13808 TaxID=2602738 RepID=UPI000F1122CD|nr:ABC transporter substrate-binding protein [Ketobacter sp. MCCC 1A13808]MVF13857.1 ABC transporter substrate-binding protein [Ketobacter sp. MCCC 1A13808]RLP54908.1 MAG: Fe3+-hydroxamate ABC transporter substrate-binding protein [Ketobacter sp.]